MIATQKRTRKKTPEYTESQKIAAVVALKLHNGMTEQGIAAVHRLLNPHVSTGTMSAWIKKYGSQIEAIDPSLAKQTAQQIMPAVIETTKSLMADGLQSMFNTALAEVVNPEKIKAASARDLAIIVGISATNLQKMSVVSPEMEQAIRRLINKAIIKQLDPVDLVNDMADSLDERPQTDTIYHDIEAS